MLISHSVVLAGGWLPPPDPAPHRHSRRAIHLLFTRSQVLAEFSPASLLARHWNMAASSRISFLITRVLSVLSAYLKGIRH